MKFYTFCMFFWIFISYWVIAFESIKLDITFWYFNQLPKYENWSQKSSRRKDVYGHFPNGPSLLITFIELAFEYGSKYYRCLDFHGVRLVKLNTYTSSCPYRIPNFIIRFLHIVELSIRYFYDLFIKTPSSIDHRSNMSSGLIKFNRVKINIYRCQLGPNL